MKTKLKLSTKHVKNYRVKITDVEGNVVMANNVKEAAKLLGLTTHTIYQQLCDNKKARGCRIEKFFGEEA